MRHRVREDLPVDAERRTWSAATTGVALLAGGGLISLLGVVFPFSPSAPEGLIAAFGAVTLLLAGGVWLVRRRIREPALHVLVVVVVVMAAFVVAHARTYAGAMVTSFPYVWIALYVAVFFTRRAAFAHAAFIVASLGVALAASGLANVLTRLADRLDDGRRHGHRPQLGQQAAAAPGAGRSRSDDERGRGDHHADPRRPGFLREPQRRADARLRAR
jgi:hypothetical protein